jgi:hypothetical protein
MFKAFSPLCFISLSLIKELRKPARYIGQDVLIVGGGAAGSHTKVLEVIRVKCTSDIEQFSEAIRSFNDVNC